MASNYDTTNIKVYDNEVIKEVLQEQLLTALNMNQFITVDDTLAANPGMTIEVHKYTGTGDVEDVAMGIGNTGDIGAGYVTDSYTVETTQGRVPYFDEQVMNDPTAVDKAIKHLAEQLTNDMTAKVVAELGGASLSATLSGTDYFGAVVDAVAQLPVENPTGLYMLISKEDTADMRKALKDDLKYVEDYVRTGYIGSVAGVPVYTCAAVAQGEAYVASKEAVTCFVKKGVEVEQEREANIRKNTVFGRAVRVVALTDDTKAVKITL